VTRVSKALILAGAAAMVLPPMMASATDSTPSVSGQVATQNGGDEDDDKGLGVLTIGAVVTGLALAGLLFAGGAGGTNPQSN